ncbi:MAG: hypothetical protein ACK4QP_12690 [Pseudorhizobium sp.]
MTINLTNKRPKFQFLAHALLVKLNKFRSDVLSINVAFSDASPLAGGVKDALE